MPSKTEPATLLHNLRNQLNNISMNAELAKLELVAQTNRKEPNYTSGSPIECVESILVACSECATIVDSLSALPVYGIAEQSLKEDSDGA